MSDPRHFPKNSPRCTHDRRGAIDALFAEVLDPSFTTKPPGEGTGLGLAMGHGIMENHDGSVTATSVTMTSYGAALTSTVLSAQPPR